MALFPGLPGWAGTRKVKPICVKALKAEVTEKRWLQIFKRHFFHASAPPRTNRTLHYFKTQDPWDIFSSVHLYSTQCVRRSMQGLMISYQWKYITWRLTCASIKPKHHSSSPAVAFLLTCPCGWLAYSWKTAQQHSRCTASAVTKSSASDPFRTTLYTNLWCRYPNSQPPSHTTTAQLHA